MAAEDQGDGGEVFVDYFQHRHYVALLFVYITTVIHYTSAKSMNNDGLSNIRIPNSYGRPSLGKENEYDMKKTINISLTK